MGRKVAWHSKQNRITGVGIIDHITLEKNLRVWHITTFTAGKKDKNWLPTHLTVPVRRGLTYWFGMSLSQPMLLEKAYGENVFRFNVPIANIDYCSRILTEAKNKSEHSVLQQPCGEVEVDKEFIHFDFLVDRRAMRKVLRFPIRASFVPKKPPALKARLENYEQTVFPIRKHEVLVGGFAGTIVLLVSKHPGVLSEKVILSGI